MRKKLSRILANSRKKFDAAKYSIFENSRKFIPAKNRCFQFAKVNSQTKKLFSANDKYKKQISKTLQFYMYFYNVCKFVIVTAVTDQLIIFLLQLNRERLFSWKMTKAAIPES